MTVGDLANPACPARPVRALGTQEVAGYALKTYAILGDGDTLDESRFAGWREIAASGLPRPAKDELRAGVGFAILHQAKVGDYLVLAWWDNGNELPLRLWISPAHDAHFRPANERESVCVWDIDIITAERDAFVAALGPAGLDSRSYLAASAVPHAETQSN